MSRSCQALKDSSLLVVVSCLFAATPAARAQSEVEWVTPVYYQEETTTQPPTTEQPPLATQPDTPPRLTRPRTSPLGGRRPSRLRGTSRSSTGTLGQYRSGYFADRIARAPNMFGDFPGASGQARLQFQRFPFDNLPQQLIFDLPGAGGGRRVKIAENNKALPTDRVFFAYNHFHNVLSTQFATVPPRSGPIDRYTIGVEKTFWDGMGSVEVRMPFSGTYRWATPFGGPTVNNGQIGNLAVILKMLLLEHEDFVFAAGLGLDTPTGSDLNVDLMPGGLLLETKSTHILPWIGVGGTPTEKAFYHMFLQLDFAASGDPLTFVPAAGPAVPVGVLTDQNLMYFDVGGGVWIHENPDAPFLTGVAVTSEFHYTTTIQDTDTVVIPGLGALGNINNRQDFSNATVGVQLQFGPFKNLHLGGVLPLRTGADQGFDSEIQIRWNCNY